MQDYVSLGEGYCRNLCLVVMHRFGEFHIIDTTPLYVYLLFFAFLCNCVSSESLVSKIASFLAELEAHLKLQPQLINTKLANYIKFGLFVRPIIIYRLISLMKIDLSCISVRER